LNIQTIEVVAKCLKLNLSYGKTQEYFKQVDDMDFRNLADGKKDNHQFEPYTQVFEEKHGYLNNLSILDLLFNEGRYALDYLKSQQL
jgi:hypothetical protein